MMNLHRGLNHLTTIAAVAPMVGLLGTIDGIFASLPGVVGESTLSAHRQYAATGFAAALFPLAYALLLTVTTKWGHSYLHHQAEALHAQTVPPPRELQ